MTLRGAISGFGEVATRGHLPGWRTRPDVQIVAIHDPIATRRHEAINLIRNIRVYDDLELMLTGEKLDFLDIASPPAYHEATAQAALAAGVNVLVEKPLALEAAALTRLTQSAHAASRIMMCVHNWKHAPSYRRAHELITSGRLGTVSYVSFLRLRSRPAGQGGSAGAGGERWRLDSRSGGGILIDHGWHVFYLAQFLLGGAEPVAAAARLSSAPGSIVDEVADVRVDFANGAVAYSHLSWRAPLRRTTAMIYGSDAMLEIDKNRLTLTARNGAVEDHSVEDANDDSYHPTWFGGMAQEFEQAIREGFDGPTMRRNLAEASGTLAIIDWARSSG
ncbi:MAG TPA: Gfo/Idh/MocA family oxidoreductase [Candidatus Binataceae bacterium]|nr:Gfo/Idh/MocA family oxidoreductase [Candidatus Binataceae bacterium]